MTLDQLEVWYGGCTESYILLKEQLTQQMVATTVTPAIPIVPTKQIVQPNEFINVVESITFIEQYNWGNRPMNSYLIKFENLDGNYILNCATETEQKQPVVGTIIKHQLNGVKITKYKFVKI
jgi:hypothetical protein